MFSGQRYDIDIHVLNFINLKSLRLLFTGNRYLNSLIESTDFYTNLKKATTDNYTKLGNIQVFRLFIFHAPISVYRLHEIASIDCPKFYDAVMSLLPKNLNYDSLENKNNSIQVIDTTTCSKNVAISKNNKIFICEIKHLIYRALVNGHLNLFKHIMQKNKLKLIDLIICRDKDINLQHFEKKQASIMDGTFKIDCEYNCLHLAARYNHLPIINYIISLFSENEKDDTKFMDFQYVQLIEVATKYGHIDLIDNCINKIHDKINLPQVISSCISLIGKYGHICVYYHFVKQGYITPDNISIIVHQICLHNHPQLLKVINVKPKNLDNSYLFMKIAIRNNSLSIVQLLYKMYCYTDAELGINILMSLDIRCEGISKFLIEKYKGVVTDDFLMKAVTKNAPNVVSLLCKRNFYINIGAVVLKTAELGRIAILKRLHNEKIDTSDYDLDILKLALSTTMSSSFIRYYKTKNFDFTQNSNDLYYLSLKSNSIQSVKLLAEYCNIEKSRKRDSELSETTQAKKTKSNN